jgi:hypothetical protein
MNKKLLSAEETPLWSNNQIKTSILGGTILFHKRLVGNEETFEQLIMSIKVVRDLTKYIPLLSCFQHFELALYPSKHIYIYTL